MLADAGSSRHPLLTRGDCPHGVLVRRGLASIAGRRGRGRAPDPIQGHATRRHVRDVPTRRDRRSVRVVARQRLQWRGVLGSRGAPGCAGPPGTDPPRRPTGRAHGSAQCRTRGVRLDLPALSRGRTLAWRVLLRGTAGPITVSEPRSDQRCAVTNRDIARRRVARRMRECLLWRLRRAEARRMDGSCAAGWRRASACPARWT
jgi:hypothetical protein